MNLKNMLSTGVMRILKLVKALTNI